MKWKDRTGLRFTHAAGIGKKNRAGAQASGVMWCQTIVDINSERQKCWQGTGPDLSGFVLSMLLCVFVCVHLSQWQFLRHTSEVSEHWNCFLLFITTVNEEIILTLRLNYYVFTEYNVYIIIIIIINKDISMIFKWQKRTTKKPFIFQGSAGTTSYTCFFGAAKTKGQHPCWDTLFEPVWLLLKLLFCPDWMLIIFCIMLLLLNPCCAAIPTYFMCNSKGSMEPVILDDCTASLRCADGAHVRHAQSVTGVVATEVLNKTDVV